GGVALVSWAAPSHSETHRGGAAVIGVMAALAAGGLVPFLLRGTWLDTALLTIVASGCGFAAGNVATKLFGDDVNAGHYPNAAAEQQRDRDQERQCRDQNRRAPFESEPQPLEPCPPACSGTGAQAENREERCHEGGVEEHEQQDLSDRSPPRGDDRRDRREVG